MERVEPLLSQEARSPVVEVRVKLVYHRLEPKIYTLYNLIITGIYNMQNTIGGNGRGGKK